MQNIKNNDILIKYYYFPKDYAKYESIQGGKMEHIFNYHKVDGKNLYNLNDFISDEAKEAFYNGKWTIKIHGSNGFITKENDNVILWERRDIGTENNKKNLNVEYLDFDYFVNNLNYKKTILPNSYNSDHKDHYYVLVPVDRKSKKGKRLYSRIEFLLKDIDNFCQSVEYVGQKVQGNSLQFQWRQLPKDYGIVFHSAIESYIPDLNSDKLIDIAKRIKIEGWVIYHNNKAWKLRTNMIVKQEDCAYSNKDVTDILGLVY